MLHDIQKDMRVKVTSHGTLGGVRTWHSLRTAPRIWLMALVATASIGAQLHAFQAGCPGCGACCIDGPVGPFCVEATTVDCLFLDGNPQAAGTDCQDLNGNGQADACEPQFPLCVPAPDGLSCLGGCPGPLPCHPTKIVYGPGGIEVLECECDIECFVDLTTAIPRCVNGCHFGSTIQTCAPFEQFLPNGSVILECQCAPAGACCRDDYSCEVTTQEKCVSEGGVYLGDDVTCSGATGACCYDLDNDGLPENCQEMDASCCAALNGSFEGEGTACEGRGACCFGFTGGGCVEVDKICCDNFLGNFLGVGSACLGDNDGNGFDDACEIDTGCAARPDGSGCQGNCLPNAFCRPSVIRRELDGTLSVVDCDCASTFDPDTCIVNLDQSTGNISCMGWCELPVTSCILFTTGYLNGAIDYECHCGDLVAPCQPTDTGNACTSACFDDSLACVPSLIDPDPLAPPVVSGCECRRPDECRPVVPNAGNSVECPGFCPPGATCTQIGISDPFGNFQIGCVCYSTLPEACCLYNADVTCQMRSVADCLSFGGTPQGEGSQCEGHEACCLPDGSCTFVDRICCDDLGGSALGPGSQCEGMGACCLDIDDGPFQYDTCRLMDKSCCDASGGVFQGLGTSCDIEACCLPTGQCQELDTRCCAASGGTPHGLGSTCADNDGNSIPDVCEDCGPVFGGTQCNPNVCPALSEECVPTMVQCTPSGASCEIVACDCQFMGSCHIEPNPFGGLPSCTGFCLFGPQTCEMKSTDSNGDGVPDLFFCRCLPELCGSSLDCDDFDVCTCDSCAIGLGFCAHTLIEYGNADCSNNQQPTIDDILCVVRGFNEYHLCVNGDVAPPCTGNNIINLDDILGVIRAFAGEDPCGCPP